MFGYVKAYKPELRIKEYETYKAVYCTICKQIGKEYAFASRFALSYDFTFLMLLYLSLREDCVEAKKGRCVYNPAKPCNFLKNDLPKMPLGASQIMLYYKLTDNIKDEGALKGIAYRFLRLFFKKGYKKAIAEFPELKEIFEEYYKCQGALEDENVQDIDRAAEPTGKMLSELFALCSADGETRALKRLGYCMGRWIYILDAAADIEDDLKRKRYNPLLELASKAVNISDFVENKVKESLIFSITEGAAAFELIDILRFKNILGNIIYLGLENTQNLVLKKEKCKK